MKLKFDRITINVKDLEKAKKFFSGLLDTRFQDKPDDFDEQLRKRGLKYEKIPGPAAPPPGKFSYKAATTPGIELFCPDPPAATDGIRNVTWRVDDMDKAMAEMKKRGIRLVHEIRCGGWREAVYAADDVYGVRWVLNEYKGDSIWDAMLGK